MNIALAAMLLAVQPLAVEDLNDFLRMSRECREAIEWRESIVGLPPPAAVIRPDVAMARAHASRVELPLPRQEPQQVVYIKKGGELVFVILRYDGGGRISFSLLLANRYVEALSPGVQAGPLGLRFLVDPQALDQCSAPGTAERVVLSSWSARVLLAPGDEGVFVRTPSGTAFRTGDTDDGDWTVWSLADEHAGALRSEWSFPARHVLAEGPAALWSANALGPHEPWADELVDAINARDLDRLLAVARERGWACLGRIDGVAHESCWVEPDRKQ